MKPLVSIVILNWNGKKHLLRCLASLSHVTYKPLEIIVVDNNSTDDSVSLVQAQFPKVRVVQNKINRGYSGGNNDGIKQSRGKYVFILNNDTQVYKGFLEVLVAVMEKNSEVGCVQPKLVYGDDHNLLNAVGSYVTSSGFLYHYGYRKAADNPQYNEQMTIFSAKGAAMMLRKKALDTVGLFDEDFFIYFEETDLCHRLWIGGFKVIYVPSSLIYHYEAVDTHRQMKTYTIMYLSYRNRIASFLKNFSFSSLMTLLPVTAISYGFLFIVYVGTGKWSLAASIVSALLWNVVQLPHTLVKRRLIQSKLRVYKDRDLFEFIWRDPPIVYYYYLFTTLKNYRNEPSLVEKNRF